jgi:hypothetical protein
MPASPMQTTAAPHRSPGSVSSLSSMERPERRRPSTKEENIFVDGTSETIGPLTHDLSKQYIWFSDMRAMNEGDHNASQKDRQHPVEHGQSSLNTVEAHSPFRSRFSAVPTSPSRESTTVATDTESVSTFSLRHDVEEVERYLNPNYGQNQSEKPPTEAGAFDALRAMISKSQAAERNNVNRTSSDTFQNTRPIPNNEIDAEIPSFKMDINAWERDLLQSLNESHLLSPARKRRSPLRSSDLLAASSRRKKALDSSSSTSMSSHRSERRPSTISAFPFLEEKSKTKTNDLDTSVSNATSSSSAPGKENFGRTDSGRERGEEQNAEKGRGKENNAKNSPKVLQRDILKPPKVPVASSNPSQAQTWPIRSTITTPAQPVTEPRVWIPYQSIRQLADVNKTNASASDDMTATTASTAAVNSLKRDDPTDALVSPPRVIFQPRSQSVLIDRDSEPPIPVARRRSSSSFRSRSSSQSPARREGRSEAGSGIGRSARSSSLPRQSQRRSSHQKVAAPSYASANVSDSGEQSSSQLFASISSLLLQKEDEENENRAIGAINKQRKRERKVPSKSRSPKKNRKARSSLIRSLRTLRTDLSGNEEEEIGYKRGMSSNFPNAETMQLNVSMAGAPVERKEEDEWYVDMKKKLLLRRMLFVEQKARILKEAASPSRTKAGQSPPLTQRLQQRLDSLDAVLDRVRASKQ